MIIMQKNWLKTQFKKPNYTYSNTAAIQFVIYRMAQKSKLQIFSKSSPNIETAFWNISLFIKFINRPIWYRYKQEFEASFYGSPYKTVMSSYVYS